MTCSPEIRPENSVRRFSRPAVIVRRLVTGSLIPPQAQILEVGPGSLRNAVYLQQMGHQVSVEEILPVVKKFKADYKSFIEKGGRVHVDQFPAQQFDVVVSTFAIETICPETVRMQVLNNIKRCLKSRGLMALALRGVPDVKTAKAKGTPYRDGYLTPGKTFVRPYTVSQVRHMLTQLGFQDIEFFSRVDAPQVVDVIARKPAN